MLKKLWIIALVLVSVLISVSTKGAWADTQSFAEFTIYDYLGYWEVVKVEQNGMDITEQVFANHRNGITFTADGALLHTANVYTNYDGKGSVMVEPFLVSCTWDFQSDGSTDVQRLGHPTINLQHDGVYLHWEDQGILFTYARAEAPDESTDTIISLEEMESLLGCWTVAKYEEAGIDVTAEFLAMCELSIVFETDGATVHLATDNGIDPPSSSDFTCTWNLSPDGTVDFSDPSVPSLRMNGDTLSSYDSFACFTFFRESNGKIADSTNTNSLSDDAASNMRMLLLQNGSSLSYCISNGRVYASAYGLARIKGCSYSEAGHAFVNTSGVIYGFMDDEDVLISDVGNDLVDLERAAEMLGLVFELDENGRAAVHQLQTTSELEAAVARIKQNSDYRKYEMFINDYYTIEYAGTEIVGNILSFEWITRIFEKLTGTYDQEQFNNGFNKIILHSGSYEQAVKSYKDIEAAIADPLSMLNWFEDAVNEEDGALFKLLKSLGDSDNEAALQVRQWGNLFYESVYSDPITADLLEMADLWEGISEVNLDKHTKEIFALVNYCSAIAKTDELTILGMRSVFQNSDNQYMRNSAQRIDDIYANNVTGGLKAGATDWFVENLNKQVGESATELLKEYGIGNDWGTATEVIKTVWGLVDEHITHSSDYIDQVALNSVLLQLQLEEYSKLVSMEPVTPEQFKEYQAVTLLYLRTLLAIYDNGYFDTDSNKAQVISNAQADLRTLLQFSYDEYATAADNEEFLNRLINNRVTIQADQEEQTGVSVPVEDIESLLSIGDYVNFGNDLTWQIVNMQDGVATLFYSGCFQGVFDASIHMEAHTINLTRYHCYGSATWEYSDIRQWLNSREITDTGLDVAFDYSNLAQGFSAMGMSAIVKVESDSYAYANQQGFLSSETFSDLEYWLLEPTEISSIVPYTQIPGDIVSVDSFDDFQADMRTVYTATVGQSQTVDRVFLLSAQEIQAYLIANNISPFVFTNGNSYPAYWLRDSVYTNLAGFYFYYGTEMLTVANNGASSKQADLNAYIRPACNVNLSYVSGLHGTGSADDPYTFEIDPDVVNRTMEHASDTSDVSGFEQEHMTQALAELLDTEHWMKTGSRDVLATHYTCVDMNEDGIKEVIIYGVDDMWVPAFEIYTYDNGAMKLIGDSVNSCDLSYWFNASHYVSICDGKYVRARTNKATIAIQENTENLLSFDGIVMQQVQVAYSKEEMLISNSTIVGGIEIGSEEDSFTRKQGLFMSGATTVPETTLLEKWGAQNEHILRAYAELMSEPIYMWAPWDTLATHYALFDEGNDNIPELVVFGVDTRYGSAGFQVYQYSNDAVKITCYSGRYYTYDTLIIYNGTDLYNNGNTSVNRTGNEEPLVMDCKIVGGIEIGSENDFLQTMLASGVYDYASSTNVNSKDNQTATSAPSSIAQNNPAFEAAFAHTANKVDKGLCLQSAYVAKKVYNQDDIVEFLIGLGFDAASIEQQDYVSNATHSVAITMAKRIVNDENGDPITLYAVIARGTEGTMEWISNFDIGNGDIALGFDKAASRVLKYFAQYVKNNPPLEGSFTDGKYKVWTCGHSRGAAVANLLAGKYLPQYVSSDNLYAYGFAVPYVDKNATICSNIFNFNIAGDFVPYVPFNSWGFERYGLTIYNPNSEIEGISVNTEANIRLMLSFLSDSVPTQEEYVSRTKEFLQILEGDPAAQEVDLSFMFKGILSTCSTVGTIPELIIKLDTNEDLEFIANLISPGSLPDNFVYTTEDFLTTYNHIVSSHAMDTYLLWIEDLCADQN